MENISKYFNAEKAESLLFVAVGLVALALATYFLIKIKHPYFTGMAYPLVAIALIQLVVGGSVYVRSPKDIERVQTIVKQTPSKIKLEEIPRMEVVMKNFVLYRWIELGLLLTGIALFLLSGPSTLWKGVGIGLSIQAGFMLLLDFFAESRGRVYLDFLRGL
jgi:hypothetical protein